MLSNMALLQLLERMGFSHITVHGFRASARNWHREVMTTQHPDWVGECCLDHAEGKTTEAYANGEGFGPRSALLKDWAAYCTSLYDKPGLLTAAE